MSDIDHKDGDLVLIRARIVGDQVRVALGDGTEVVADAADVVAEVPRAIGSLMHPLLLFFETADDRLHFAADFFGAGCVDL